MFRPELLKDDEIADLLSDFPFWKKENTLIVKEIAASNFAAAIGIVNSVAVLAEKADHHPDILIYGWNKIRIMLSTHDKGGLTKLDFELAKKIDELNF
ncbi:MAG: 4a-hydroxytetrahydrobiopterin dehydratase [Candidatus Kapabacteria bacterium]|nr:4a-hydroxytetrahydrobiopterin dehydratase [Ignavibacteriota bacterium]MCW5884787.1 4a-hydroxytetrahydrobiopterin dehydratase [Candidatus Kapabacteria bacterium]